MPKTVTDHIFADEPNPVVCPSWCAVTATQVWSCRGEHYADVGSVMATAEHPAPLEDEPELYHVEVNVGLNFSQLPEQTDECPGVTWSLMGPKFDVGTALRSAEARQVAALILEACDKLDRVKAAS